MNNTVCHIEPIFISDCEKGTIILKVGAGTAPTTGKTAVFTCQLFVIGKIDGV